MIKRHFRSETMRSSQLLSCLLVATGAIATVSPGSLVTITTAADPNNAAAWWDPLDEAGGYDWLAYLRNPTSGSTANNNVMVVRRAISDGSIIRDCLKTSSGDCALFLDDAGHNAPSVAVDGDGYVVSDFQSLFIPSWLYPSVKDRRGTTKQRDIPKICMCSSHSCHIFHFPQTAITDSKCHSMSLLECTTTTGSTTGQHHLTAAQPLWTQALLCQIRRQTSPTRF